MTDVALGERSLGLEQRAGAVLAALEDDVGAADQEGVQRSDLVDGG